jgi:hypothetical protein
MLLTYKIFNVYVCLSERTVDFLPFFFYFVHFRTLLPILAFKFEQRLEKLTNQKSDNQSFKVYGTFFEHTPT